MSKKRKQKKQKGSVTTTERSVDIKSFFEMLVCTETKPEALITQLKRNPNYVEDFYNGRSALIWTIACPMRIPKNTYFVIKTLLEYVPILFSILTL